MSQEREKFEKRFDTIEKEVLVLTEGGTSSSRWGENKLWQASVTVLAVVDVATGELTEKKCNLNWQMTKEDFAKRLMISKVCVSTDGNFEIFYDDDDMFWGHVVIVSGNIETGIDDAYIAGQQTFRQYCIESGKVLFYTIRISNFGRKNWPILVQNV